MAEQAQKPLQGGITFDAVKSQPGFSQETPEFQNKIADDFFAKHVASQPGFDKEAPETQLQIRTDFNKKYNIGQVDTLSDPLKAINSAVSTATLAAGGVLNPASDGFIFGLGGDSNQQARDLAKKQFPGIQTDPGWLGDAYRFNSNPIANNIGGFAGGLANAGKLAAGLPALAVPAVQSGITNIGQVLQGKQNPLQALGNTAINSVAGLIPNGQNFLTTALKQGAGGALAGAASSAIGDATNGRAVNIPAAFRTALEQGAIQAGTGAAFHLPQGEALAQARQAAMPKEPVKFQGRPVQQFGPADRLISGRPEQIIDRAVKSSATRVIRREQPLTSVPEGIRARVSQEVEAFNKKNAARQELNAAKIRQAVGDLAPNRADELRQLRESILERNAPVSAQAKFKERLSQLDQVTRTKSNAQIQNTKAKIDLEKARKNTVDARIELRNARASKNQQGIQQAESKLAKAVDSEKALRTPQNPLKGEVRIIGPGKNLRTIEQAIREGKAIQAEHHANKYGTGETSTFEKKFDYPFETSTYKRVVDARTKKIINQAGTDKFLKPDSRQAQELIRSGKAEVKDVPFYRAVNENGQIRTRHLEDLKGSVSIAENAHPYSVELNDNGAFKAVNAQTGEDIAQYQEASYKHRDLKAKIDNASEIIDKLKKGENVKVKDIVSATYDLSHEQFKELMDSVPPEKVDEIAKELGC
jgi:hypothetical protein